MYMCVPVFVCVTESLCCTLETNTNLQVNYASIKVIKNIVCKVIISQFVMKNL